MRKRRFKSEEGEKREKGRKIVLTYQVSVIQNLNFKSSLPESHKTQGGFECTGGKDLTSKSFQSAREKMSSQTTRRNMKALLVNAVPCSGPGLQDKVVRFRG